MSMIAIICITFALIGLSTSAAILWVTWYPKMLCQRIRSNDAKYNVCVKLKYHDGAHMTAEGKSFWIKDDFHI